MRRRVGQYDADPVIAIEHAGELLVEAADAQVEIGEHLLGGEVEGVDVVLAVIEEVADLFERCRRARRFDFVAGDRRPIGLQLAGHRNEAPVHPDHRLADGGHPGDKFRDLCLADAVELGVLGGLGQITDEPGVGIGGEVVGRQVEFATQSEQHGDRQRAVIVLQLVDVARRQVEAAGQRSLGESLLFS